MADSMQESLDKFADKIMLAQSRKILCMYALIIAESNPRNILKLNMDFVDILGQEINDLEAKINAQ
jgi:hypothetical protein